MPDFEKSNYATAAVRPPRLPGPVNDVKDAVERAATLCSRIEALADRLVGSVPESDTASGGMAGSDGLFNELAGKAHYLNGRIADAERALERIEKVAL